MGIILVNRFVQSLLSTCMENLINDTASIIPEIYSPDMYKPTEVSQLVEYYGGNRVKVKGGYPSEEVSSPSVYVATGNANLIEEMIGFAERYDIVASETVGTMEGKVYNKSCRVVVASENHTVSDTLSGICEYFLHQNEETFTRYGMTNLHCSFQEVDLLSRLFPQGFFYRTFIVTFDVVDTMIVSKDRLIKTIDIGTITFNLEGE